MRKEETTTHHTGQVTPTTYHMDQSAPERATHIIVPVDIFRSMVTIMMGLPYRDVNVTLNRCDAECFATRMAGRSEPALAKEE